MIVAGPGGLSAAILLARVGVKVTAFERLPHVGGRTSTFSADGFRFDHGPTFFLYPQVPQEILATVGRNLFQGIPMVKLDP